MGHGAARRCCAARSAQPCRAVTHQNKNLFGNASFRDPTMEMVFRAVRTIKLIGKVRAIYHPITNQVSLGIVSKLSHAARLGNTGSWSVGFGGKILAIQHGLDFYRQNGEATLFEFVAKVPTWKHLFIQVADGLKQLA